MRRRDELGDELDAPRAGCKDNDVRPIRSIEWLEPEFVRLLRSQSGTARLAAGFRLHRFAKRMLADGIKSRHPDWTAEQVGGEVARRLRDGAR